MEKYTKQFRHAAELSGVNIPQMLDLSKNHLVVMGGVSGENLVVAKAVDDKLSDIRKIVTGMLEQGYEGKTTEIVHCDGDVKFKMFPEKFHVMKELANMRVVMNGENGGYHSLDGNDFVPIYFEDSKIKYIMSDRNLRQDAYIVHGNSYGFSRYSTDKYLSGIILRSAGVNAPKELMFRETKLDPEKTAEEYIPEYVERAKKRFEKVKDFLGTLDPSTEIVLKPRNGCQGNDIHFFTIPEILEAQDYICIHPETITKEELAGEPQKYDDEKTERFEILRIAIGYGNHLIQERIQSYPLEIDGKKKDWNVRVLVSYCDRIEQYVMVGITGRIDDDGGPVNRSISAENISLQEICSLAGIEDKYEEIYASIEKEALKATKATADAGARKLLMPVEDNWQDLAGVDIVIDPNRTASVIETNNADSGCVYELVMLEGMNSIKPIADSIIAKLSTNVSRGDFVLPSRYDIVDLPLEGKYSLQENTIKFARRYAQRTAELHPDGEEGVKKLMMEVAKRKKEIANED